MLKLPVKGAEISAKCGLVLSKVFEMANHLQPGTRRAFTDFIGPEKLKCTRGGNRGVEKMFANADLANFIVF